ncbi:MAG TPA: hydroxyisourate hydrolase [Streptosporangiaceae bacterium]|nr:hydroxyisourate hydrolase [Streptosporangiaceae bacterium]
MGVSVRVFDCMCGKPPIGLSVRLDREFDGAWITEKKDLTDHDGRINDWVDSPLPRGAYKLEFDLDSYFSSLGVMSFYPVVALSFRVFDPNRLLDISLLITPYAYFTYQQNDMRTIPFIGAMDAMSVTPDGGPAGRMP